MKKSILLTTIAMLFVVATAWGQTDDTNPTPVRPTDCSENGNFPAIGIPHEYEVQITNSNGFDGNGVYNWYVTENAGDLVTETGIVTVSDNYFDVSSGPGTGLSTYHSDTETTKKIGLVWKTDALLNTEGGTKTPTYFLVLKYSEEATVTGTTCTTMNMKVMKIEPLNQFKLDIEPVQDKDGNAFGATQSASTCAADIAGAAYDASKNSITYTYGENSLYYKVTASGFAGKWKPQISLPALSDDGMQKYVSAEWSDDNGENWHSFNANTTAEGASASQTLSSTDLATIASVAVGGTPSATYIYKVVIDNNKHENLTHQTLSVATDGTYGGTDNLALKDQREDCQGDEDAFADKDDYTIKARPTIKATSGGFIQRIP